MKLIFCKFVTHLKQSCLKENLFAGTWCFSIRYLCEAFLV
jgi:hypothetical protein